MNNVIVIQRHAHLAGAVKLEFVKGREGQLARAVLTAISNQYRGRGQDREERSIAIRWTLWGPQAENAAEYLGMGSHVNLVGRVHNTQYQDSEGIEVHGLEFTVEDIDYLDSKAEREARRARHGAPSKAHSKARIERQPVDA
ncbi:MAG: single-stranded DNA-binding protein [Burkholderiales bacterium]|nr:MAG: single-stranded DNA-binding protein [Burkholderiales bacterium]